MALAWEWALAQDTIVILSARIQILTMLHITVESVL